MEKYFETKPKELLISILKETTYALENELLDIDVEIKACNIFITCLYELANRG